uniref:Putative secreted protein n=1 Tax=Anopheles darlingi TaxID=43151 RepID=A0A2M4D3D5_ANODA
MVRWTWGDVVVRFMANAKAKLCGAIPFLDNGQDRCQSVWHDHDRYCLVWVCRDGCRPDDCLCLNAPPELLLPLSLQTNKRMVLNCCRIMLFHLVLSCFK